MSELEKLQRDLQQASEERDELRMALCVARENARKIPYAMTTRKFAAFCGMSPTRLCRWTDNDCDSPPDFVD